MSTFIMLGKYTTEGVKGATAARTGRIVGLVEDCEGKVDSIYALLGEHDLAFIVEFPNLEHAIKASYVISKTAGISFTTYPALPVKKFDRLIGK